LLFQTMQAKQALDIPFSGKANRVEEVPTLMVLASMHKERQNAYSIVVKETRHYLTLISIRDRMREIPYYSIVLTDQIDKALLLRFALKYDFGLRFSGPP